MHVAHCRVSINVKSVINTVKKVKGLKVRSDVRKLARGRTDARGTGTKIEFWLTVGQGLTGLFSVQIAGNSRTEGGQDIWELSVHRKRGSDPRIKHCYFPWHHRQLNGTNELSSFSENERERCYCTRFTCSWCNDTRTTTCLSSAIPVCLLLKVWNLLTEGEVGVD